ncbi:MAG: rod shape-determining protein MreC [Bernardetiaceae bacterium]
MRQLITFFYRYRVTLLFLFLEGVAFWLIYQNNPYQRLVWLSSANQWVGQILEVRASLGYYVDLTNVNRDLAIENARLRQELEQLRIQTSLTDSPVDSALTPYRFISARVLKYSLHQTSNFLTINKGSDQGLRPGMALITGNGIVGRIKNVSENFATAYPLIHPRFRVSVTTRREEQLFSVRWPGGDPRLASLDQVSRGANVAIGDTLLTSGRDAVFPEGMPVGIIEAIDRNQGAGFLSVKLRFLVDFTRLSYVYAVDSRYKAERDSLEQVSFPKD